jgi:hypothetical protein
MRNVLPLLVDRLKRGAGSEGQLVDLRQVLDDRLPGPLPLATVLAQRNQIPPATLPHGVRQQIGPAHPLLVSDRSDAAAQDAAQERRRTLKRQIVDELPLNTVANASIKVPAWPAPPTQAASRRWPVLPIAERGVAARSGKVPASGHGLGAAG